MKLLASIVFASGLCVAPTAQAFEIEFDWSGLKSCTSGYPNTVNNPKFLLKDVPEGTKFIRFKLTDLDVPDFDHGGGLVAYSGQDKIASGAFTYQSPCPPDGSHLYQWRATAQKNKGGGRIGTATAEREYP